MNAWYWLAYLLILLALVVGCAGPVWVTRDGGPMDPKDYLRCDEYVQTKNGMRFTGFEETDRIFCLRSLGYVRPSEVRPR